MEDQNINISELTKHCGMSLEEFLAEEEELKHEIPGDLISIIPGKNISYNPIKILSCLPYILIVRPIMDYFEYP